MILENLKALPKTDPTNLICLRDSIYATDLLITAIGKFDFFTWLDANPSDFNYIVNHFQINSRPTDVMLTYFKSLGLIEEENNVYRVTDLSKEHLTAHSNWSLVPYFSTQVERPIVEKLVNVLITGEPESWAAKKNESDWAKAMKREDFAEMFIAGMDSRGAYLAPGLANSFDFSPYNSIIDIAGASGIYIAAIKAKYNTIRGALFEKPPVDRIARQGLKRRNLENTIEVFAGDIFSDYIPKGFDIHLFSHVLHDWNMEQNRILVKNSYQSLNRSGVIMIHDAHLNDNKTGPLSVAEYSILLMFSTYGKCYSFPEIKSLLEEEGFTGVAFQKTLSNRSIITGKK